MITKRKGPIPIPLYDRFNEKVDRSGGSKACWPWLAGTDGHKYGVVGSGGPLHRMIKAHRVAWEQEYGPIPKGMNVLHRCDNPPCCNPHHLFLGTKKDNTQDMMTKGRNRFVTRSGEEHGQAKLTKASVQLMRRRYEAGGVTMEELGIEFGVTKTAARNAIRGRTWKQ